MLTENVDFANPKNDVAIARNDVTTGAPTHYAVRAYGNVVSGMLQQQEVEVGAFQRFRSIELDAVNVTEIISVFDSQGNEYFEVDYLAQDIVFKELANNNYKNDNVPSVIKPFLVARKFVVEYQRDKTIIQFGSGNENESNVVAKPQAVAMDMYGKTYTTDKTFDPTKLTNNQNFGIVPSNTTLTIIYRSTNPTNSNVAVNALTNVASRVFDYKNRSTLNSVKVQDVNDSLEVTNETPILGDTSFLSAPELKRRVFDTFPTQNRAVTQADYENIAYRMPPKFGSIKRVSVQRDADSQKRNLNMYVVSEDKFGKLVVTNDTIKSNLKTWLNNYRMLSDTIDILDPFILNIGIEFVIKPMPSANKFVVLDRAIEEVRSKFTDTQYIGEQFSISDVYSFLKEVPGVLDVLKVKVVPKTTSEYSQASITINDNLSPDGNYLIVPKNAIVEIKFPQVDIKGKVR